jgi:DNA-binding NarL/FixJ family response regulator
MVRVVVAEPSGLIRSLVRFTLSKADITIVGETVGVVQLLDLTAAERPDVVVANCELDDGDLDPHLDGLTSTGARVLVLSGNSSPERAARLLAGGVSGYLVHDTRPDAVVEAVLAVAGGQVVLHPAAASVVVEQWRGLRQEHVEANPRVALTAREREVLAAMVDGLSTKAMARRLGVAVKTVENHKTRVFDKLGVRTQAHAVALTLTSGLLDEPGPEPAGTPVPTS